MICFGVRAPTTPIWMLDWASYRELESLQRFEQWVNRGKKLGSRRVAYSRYLAAKRGLPTPAELSWQGQAPAPHALPAFDAWYRGQRVDPRRVKVERAALVSRMKSPGWRAIEGPAYPGDRARWLSAVQEAMTSGHRIRRSVMQDFEALQVKVAGQSSSRTWPSGL